MKEVILNSYIRMFDLLDVEAKLELLVKLSENVKDSFKKPTDDKEEILDTLSGTWSDVDDSIVDDIYESRTIYGLKVDFDSIDG